MIMINDLLWEKQNGLVPCVIQDAATGMVLMLGFMNKEALQQTIDTKLVTFFSRSKKRLWVKGEESGNHLAVVSMEADCDRDTLLIQAIPAGNVCHTGSVSCFKNEGISDWSIIRVLENIILSREQLRPEKVTLLLLEKGISRAAQKVGEEAIEVALAAAGKNDEELCEEIADLMFHLLVLLRLRNISISQALSVLNRRNANF